MVPGGTCDGTSTGGVMQTLLANVNVSRCDVTRFYDTWRGRASHQQKLAPIPMGG